MEKQVNFAELLAQIAAEESGKLFRDRLRGFCRIIIMESITEEVKLLCGDKHHPQDETPFRRAGSASGSSPDGTQGKWFYTDQEAAVDTLNEWSYYDNFYQTKTTVESNAINNIFEGIDSTATMPQGKTAVFIKMEDLENSTVEILE